MIKIIEYQPAHMDLFAQKKEDVERYGTISSETQNQMAELGVAFTAIADGRILVIGGVLPIAPCKGHCWTMVSEHASGHSIAVVRVVKRQLESIMDTMGLRRVETSNIETATEHHKWCRLLGFEQEGRMRLFDERGRTYIRFAKFKED